MPIAFDAGKMPRASVRDPDAGGHIRTICQRRRHFHMTYPIRNTSLLHRPLAVQPVRTDGQQTGSRG